MLQHEVTGWKTLFNHKAFVVFKESFHFVAFVFLLLLLLLLGRGFDCMNSLVAAAKFLR